MNSPNSACNGYMGKVRPYIAQNSAKKRLDHLGMVETIRENDSSLVRAARTFLGSFLRFSLSKICVVCDYCG